jgi:hypothetical protein
MEGLGFRLQGSRVDDAAGCEGWRVWGLGSRALGLMTQPDVRDVCFTICLCIGPDLDGYRATKMRYRPRMNHEESRMQGLGDLELSKDDVGKHRRVCAGQAVRSGTSTKQ